MTSANKQPAAQRKPGKITPMASTSLTIKQENFCQVYVETGNASEAYRRAYDAKNMKSETVRRTAKELPEKPAHLGLLVLKAGLSGMFGKKEKDV